MIKEDITAFIQNEQYLEAEKLVEEALAHDVDNLELLFLKADVLKKLQLKSEAVNLYNYILSIDPDNKRAEVERDLIHMIMLQENIDKFECTNLYDDPWL
ncbi:MAG: tetratricopeptide repeat protein [Bacteroidales bacterium]|nr:tetratricopeptide repeat protein [Bacteroidales bacterium]